ncbi:nucleoporin NDC1 isoform X2 [Eurytemora carolleeae]|uniref:nucleoporin NDC1 isoform X2 n=1 Tax=Eurytemora carolleeae TaxID=1294199 RepID=UPI000C784D3C|nr:nucleoporin NDC1 isoform X2 [Eurytemora carolleeae]|eukprot:XP_023336873.1 nucleoporin NDC1-like isoform X2 [Eurytemora affinis]
MSGTEDWFLDSLRGRTNSAGAWAVAVSTGWTTLVTAIFLLVQAPTEGLMGMLLTCLSRLTSSDSFFYLVILAVLVVFWTKLQAKYASVIPCVAKSVVWTLAQTFRPEILISFLQFIGFGFCSSWLLLQIVAAPFSNLTAPCKEIDSSFCYNKVHIFLLFAGVFSGLVEAIVFHFKNGNYTSIPIIGLDRFSQFKIKLDSNLMRLCLDSFYTLRVYYPLYLVISVLFGGIFRPAGLGYLELLSPTLVAHCWLVVLYVKVLRFTISSWVSVNLTQPVHLELANLLEGVGSTNLLLSTLLLQNLVDQVAEKPDIRREVFSLSLPGGHPHTWNSILSLCHRHIVSMKDDLNSLLSPAPPAPAKEIGPIEPPPPPQIELLSPNIRRLAPTSARQVVPVLPIPPSLPGRINQFCESVLDSLKRRPLVGWLVNQAPDVPFRVVFTRSQLVIFCVEILSFLVSASIKEDRYGVVQKDLPYILTNLLLLEQNIDRCRGHGVPYYRKKSADIPDVHLKHELKSAVKSAIFRIVVEFKEHILNVPLPADLSQKIKNYQQFLEA